MRLGASKPKTSEPKPVISAPIAGSMRKMVPNRDGSVPPNPMPGDRTGRPHQEYPHNRPALNNLTMRRGDGGLELLRLPSGSRLSEPMPASPSRSDSVDIASLGWPQNNRDTDQLHRLKDAHTQSLTDLNNARMAYPRLTSEEKRTLDPSALKARKREIAQELKAHEGTLKGLERAEHQARREVDVFKGRFSKELSAEANFRQSQRPTSHGSMLSMNDAAPSAPRPRAPKALPGPEGSRAPTLPTIPERDPSPERIELPRGARFSDGRMESSAKLGPVKQRLADLQEEYRSAKNIYHGMKPESARYTPGQLSAARQRYKDADTAFIAYRKGNKASLALEEKGHELPPLDELRQLLHPRSNDNYPAFPATGTSAGSVLAPGTGSGQRTPEYRPGPSAIPSIPPPPPTVPDFRQDPIQRTSAPAPDHPRNRTAGPEYGLDYYGL